MAVMIVFVKNYLDTTATWEQMQDKEMFVWHCPIKEARKGFFGCYSVCETMKDTKEG